VHVLTEALAADCAARTGVSKAQAKYEADAAIQNLLGYLKEYTDGGTPPENVIIFDEAQRAWNEKVGQKLMGRARSEPALFLDILDRLDWSCLVCLFGPGQEINRGEGGLALWGAALAQAAESGSVWKIIAAPQAIDGGPSVSGAGLAHCGTLDRSQLHSEPGLHLSNGVRAYRNPLHGDWVAALLDSQIGKAKSISARMASLPAVITRDLRSAKARLSEFRRGGRSVGLLTSSGAVRLVGEGVPPAPRSDDLTTIGHWFLNLDFSKRGVHRGCESPISCFARTT
jgi:hypothetical protein